MTKQTVNYRLEKLMRSFGSLIVSILLFFTACTRPASPPPVEPSPAPFAEPEFRGEHILIDTKSRVLYVKRDSQVIAFFPGIAYSPEGPGIKQRRGDGVTPLGEFRIAWITRASNYRIFLGFNYPTPDYAKRGLETGVITQKEYLAILKAHEEGRPPSQNTKLGGQLGIHGLGNRPLQIHRISHWTRGCLALDNAQIEELLPLVFVGMRVIVR